MAVSRVFASIASKLISSWQFHGLQLNTLRLKGSSWIGWIWRLLFWVLVP